MTDDILLNKSQTIEKCIQRIRQVYQGHESKLEKDYDLQDVLILNLQRACEAAIDMAAHVVRSKRLGVPQNSRDFFELLAKQGLISSEINKKMQSMVGFRNIATHDYQKLNLKILRSIVEKDLPDFLAFTSALLKHN